MNDSSKSSIMIVEINLKSCIANSDADVFEYLTKNGIGHHLDHVLSILHKQTCFRNVLLFVKDDELITIEEFIASRKK